MSSTPELPGQLGEPPSGEFGEYQAVSALAVASLIAGVASATALVGVALWIVPVVGILLSWLALIRIGRSAGLLTGRPLALAGLGLAVCFGAAAITDHLQAKRLAARDAQYVASQWFEALAQGKPEVADQWTRGPGTRAGAVSPELLKSYYDGDKEPSAGLAKFVGQKVIAVLLTWVSGLMPRLESTTANDLSTWGWFRKSTA